MFSKTKKKPADQKASQQPRAVPSIISADLKITGDLVSNGEIQVDGEVTGDIKSNVLLIGETATVNGEIRAETVRVHGRINGQIRATFVNLAKSAHVVGDILHENISIQEGAFLEGHIMHMSDEQIKSAKADMASGRIDTPAEDNAVKVAEAKSDAKPTDERVNLVVKPGNKGGATPSSNQGSQPQAKPQQNQTKTA